VSAPAAQPPADAPWTVGRILEWTTQYLQKHGSDSPRLDAELLLAKARGCPRIQLYVQFNEVVPDSQRTVMRDLVKRRTQAEPVAYLIGRREFFGLEFRVTRDVLVPRPDTETLVLELVTEARKFERPRILDVGTGSGCIAIAAAVSVPTALVTAVDDSSAALAVARENAARHKTGDRVTFLEGDMFAPVPPGTMFDFVASNPPYVADGEIEQLPPDIRQHEPLQALRGGRDGHDEISRLLAGAPLVLKPGGKLLVEFSPEQADLILQLCGESPGFREPKILKDLEGRARVLVATRQPG